MAKEPDWFDGLGLSPARTCEGESDDLLPRSILRDHPEPAQTLNVAVIGGANTGKTSIVRSTSHRREPHSCDRCQSCPPLFSGDIVNDDIFRGRRSLKTWSSMSSIQTCWCLGSVVGWHFTTSPLRYSSTRQITCGKNIVQCSANARRSSWSPTSVGWTSPSSSQPTGTIRPRHSPTLRQSCWYVRHILVQIAFPRNHMGAEQIQCTRPLDRDAWTDVRRAHAHS